MEKINYSKIIEELYNIIYFDEIDDDYISMEQFVLAEKFCNIVLKNFNFNNFCDDPKFTKTFRKEKTVEYAKNFLNTLNLEYSDKLNGNIQNGILKFTTLDECNTGCVDATAEKKIRVPLRNDLSDTFILVHEQIHDTTMNNTDLSASWSYFCETPALLSEFLMKDFLKDCNINEKELKKYLRFGMSSIIYRALMLKVQISMLKEILTSGYIDKIFISNLVIEIFNICKTEYLTYDAIDDSITKLFQSNECFYFFDLRYVIGFVLSSYLHNMIIENPRLLKEFPKYNESFMKLDIQGVFESIGLNFGDGNMMDIIESDYEKLEKCYKKELNRVW